MTQHLLAISQADLERIERQLSELNDRLSRFELVPKPEWLTVKEYAASIGRSERTVARYIEQGRVVTKEECGVTLIKAAR